MSTLAATRSIRKDFMKVVDAGDERATKDFIIDHLAEFPDDVQTQIISAFFLDALGKEADAIEARAAIQKQALAALAEVEKAEKTLADETKKREVKKGLGI